MQIDAANVLALVTGATALLLGAWDRLNQRRAARTDETIRVADGSRTAEATFRDDLMARISRLEDKEKELLDRNEKLLHEMLTLTKRIAELQGEIIVFSGCSLTGCPMRQRITIRGGVHASHDPEE